MKVPDDLTAPLVLATPAPSAPLDSTFAETWTCPQCTLINEAHFQNCEACAFAKNSLLKQGEEDTNAANKNAVSTGPFDTKGAGAYPAPVVGPRQCDIDVYEIAQDEDPFAKKSRRRRRRRWHMAAGGTAGAILGAILFCGPWGLVVGGAGGVGAARIMSKRGERKKDIRVANSKLTNAVIT